MAQVTPIGGIADAAVAESLSCGGGDAAFLQVTHDQGTGSRQWWMVACLTLLSMLAMIDKNVIALLVLPIQHSLGISKTQIGLAIGAAFAIGNLGFGAPAGWMADRFHRKLIIAFAVILWSLMAALCGFAASFTALFAARVGVGIAESLIPPSAYSLINDGVSRARRGRVFGAYAMSSLLGTGLAFLLGGLLTRFIAEGGLSQIPELGTRQPWSIALILTGVLGLPLVLLLLTFREPSRQVFAERDAVSYREAWRICIQQRAIFLPLAVFSISQAMLAQSLQTWVPAVVSVRFALTPAQIGPILGGLLIFVGPLGLTSSGLLVDRFEGRSIPGAAAVAMLFSGLLLAVVPIHPLAQTADQFWFLQGVILLAINTYLAVTPMVVTQAASGGRVIGTLMAFFLVGQGLLGAGLGPTLTAFVSDHILVNQSMSLAASMSLVHSCLAAVSFGAAIVLYINCRNLKSRGSGGP